MKKLLVIFAIIFMASVLTAPDVRAAAAWYTCTVVKIGVDQNSASYVQLTDTGGAFTAQWFKLDATRAKEQLAVAMFAVGNGKNVLVNLSGVASSWSDRVLAIYISN